MAGNFRVGEKFRGKIEILNTHVYFVKNRMLQAYVKKLQISASVPELCVARPNWC